MNLSKRCEYALRAMLDLTMAQAVNRPLVPLTALAYAQRISATFLQQILIDLRQAGFLISVRGKYGGYSLAKPADEIFLGELVRYLDGPIAPITCASMLSTESCCLNEEQCGLRLVMVGLRNTISKMLDEQTLKQLSDATLQNLRRDGLAPPGIGVRHDFSKISI